MNRHHYSLYVHNCRLVFLLRRDFTQVDTFRPAEFHWKLEQVRGSRPLKVCFKTTHMCRRVESASHVCTYSRTSTISGGRGHLKFKICHLVSLNEYSIQAPLSESDFHILDAECLHVHDFSGMVSNFAVFVCVRACARVRVQQLSARVEGVTQIHMIPHSHGKDV